MDEQARRLHALEPYGISEDLEPAEWTRDGYVLHARYEGESAPAGFELRLWPDQAEAARWYQKTVDRLERFDPVQEMNAFEGSEHCVRVPGGTRCIGVDDHRTIISTSTGVRGDFGAELDALLLNRTARKHWFRVFR